RTEERDDLAGIEGERHVEQYLRLPIEGVDACELEHQRSFPRLELRTHGFSRSSSGVPRAITWPQWIAAIVSASANRNSMSCSIATSVSVPLRLRIKSA